MSDKQVLTPEEIYKLILEILSAERMVQVGIPNLAAVKLTLPLQSHKLYADFLETSKLAQYISEGMISENHIPEDFISEFFSVEDAEKVEDVSSSIVSYRTLLSKRIKGSEQYINDLSKIKELEEQKSDLLFKKTTAKQFTSEYRAREDKHLYLLSQCTFTLNGTKLWNSVEELLDDNTIYNSEDVYLLLNYFLDFYFGHNVKVMRQIARSPTWRTYYLASKDGIANVFTRSGADLTLDQLGLMGWSKWYDGIFEMSIRDKPSDSIIEDDDALDKYVQEYIRKLTAEVGVSKSRESGKKALDQDHVIVTASSSNYVKFQKEGKYSDTALISGRAKEGSSAYNESKEVSDLKKRITKKRGNK